MFKGVKEWTYANVLNKLIIPIVFEPSLLNIMNWPSGIIQLYLGSTLYIDCIYNDSKLCAFKIHEYLIKLKLKPYGNPIKNIDNNLKTFKLINNKIKSLKKKYLQPFIFKNKEFNNKSKILNSNINLFRFSNVTDSERDSSTDSYRDSDTNSENLLNNTLSFKENRSILTISRVPPRIAPVLKKV